MTQMGFFDLSDRYASLDAKKDPLVEMAMSEELGLSLAGRLRCFGA